MRSNMLVLALAIVLGGIAAILARNWLLSHGQTEQAGAASIVVAATPLTFGTQLSPENLKEIPWSTGALPDGAFASKREVLNDGRRMALAPLARNEPILH